MPSRLRFVRVLSSVKRLRPSALVLLSCLTLNFLSLSAIGQTPPPAPSGTNSATPASLDRPILKIGSQGESVRELQGILKLLGYYRGAVDGNYQQSTADAVSTFQQLSGLSTDGIVGSETWSRLLPPSPTVTATATAQPSPPPTPSPTPAPAPSPAAAVGDNAASIDLPTLRRGMRGSAIERLQERLRSLEFYSGEVDGIFGAQTQTAVEAAQRNFGLEPDGIVGPATWEALLR